jgi:hypothetical protein
MSHKPVEMSGNKPKEGVQMVNKYTERQAAHLPLGNANQSTARSHFLPRKMVRLENESE